jgi:inner membrane protein
MMYQMQEKPAGFSVWLKESVTAKLIFIVILTLVLLIPSVMIGNLIDERAARRDEVIKDVSYNFAGNQVIKGPVLVIPYWEKTTTTDAHDKADTSETVENLYVLPNQLSIKAALKTEVMHRGIFDAVVYKTQVHISGNFAQIDLSMFGIKPEQLLPGKAFVTFSISDLKGLKTSPEFKLGAQTLTATPASSNAAFINGLQVAAANAGDLNKGALPFNYTLDLNGTDGLSFLQLGKTTDVELNGNWGTPSFDGRFLPDTRKVNGSDFDAHWRVLYYNSPFPQQWVGYNDLLNNDAKQQDATFGVKLRLPVDEYQETTRTNKYAILIILLTFVSLFLTELIRKQKIHSFNYVLIGAAMVIFYTLLLSFSEQIGFSWAYLIASVATIGLIATFIASLLKNRGAALSFAGILSVFYAFIFIIIQLEDFALMAGSIALFIIVALLMYFSRKINWNQNDEKLIATNDFI